MIDQKTWSLIKFQSTDDMMERLGDCQLCGGRLDLLVKGSFDTRFGIKGTYDIVRCSKCSVIQLSPYPQSNEMEVLYKKYYNFGTLEFETYSRLRSFFFKSFIYRLWMYIDGDISFHLLTGRGRLLDVGCNEGRGLQIYRKNGFEVEGLEPNELAAKAAIKKGFKIYTKNLESFQPSDSFDVVVLSNVLEHSLHPIEMLRHTAHILKSDGQIWVSCPNVESWQRKLFGRYWINWHVPFHIVHFSQKTLTNILKETGFEIQEIRQESPALWVAHSIIVRLFAQFGQPTKQLRNPFLVAALLILIRILFFPLLWIGNRLGRGDCLVVVARKST